MLNLRVLSSRRFGPLVLASVGIIIGALGWLIGLSVAIWHAPAPLALLGVALFIIGWLVVASMGLFIIIRGIRKLYRSNRSHI